MRVAGVLLVAVVALSALLATRTGLRLVTGVDLAVLRAIETLRWEPLLDMARTVVDLLSIGAFQVTVWVILLTLVLVRRFQHLFASLALLLVVPLAAVTVRQAVGRMRPAGVEITAHWDGYAYPSWPVTAVALAATVATLVLAPRGRWRSLAAWSSVGVLSLVVLARLYTAVDHPTDVLGGLTLGVAVPFLALRVLTPDEAYPVSYHRGVRAHLDVSGRRGDAIRAAFAAQLDLQVLEVEPFALRGSAGSTPLRITTTDGVLFGKLYAAVHLRSDRWYKLARTVLYGRLEDERPFNSVRRLVQHEDHMLRVLRDAGVPTAAPHGIVEITPEREYVLVSEMIGDARQLGGDEVTDDVIDRALGVVRAMWDAGIAHRDIKPSNLLVADGKVWLIDVAFAEVRPSPWRQAVDLANMMLCLALGSSAEQVYGRAVEQFAPEDLAEAFAATRSVTVPAQLRSLLRERDDDVLAQFRALAPPRPPVAIQRWTLRRVGLTLALLGVVITGVVFVIGNLSLAGLL